MPTSNWTEYYQAVAGQPARGILLKALDLFEATPQAQPKFAIDLGCGSGRDSLALLEQGWQVLAIDGEAEALAALTQATPSAWRPRLQTQQVTFEAMSLPQADLINASFALPFCSPEHYSFVWQKITQALNPHGRFVGQFFGSRDEWAANSAMTFHTAEQVKTLLTPFDIEIFREIEEDGQTATGQPKHWHLFTVIAQKN